MKTSNTVNRALDTIGYYLLAIAGLILTAIFVCMAYQAGEQIINL